MNLETYLSTWDFAEDGSPTTRTLMSPLRFMPSRVTLCTPPSSISSTLFLMSTWP